MNTEDEISVWKSVGTKARQRALKDLQKLYPHSYNRFYLIREEEAREEARIKIDNDQ